MGPKCGTKICKIRTLQKTEIETKTEKEKARTVHQLWNLCELEYLLLFSFSLDEFNLNSWTKLNGHNLFVHSSLVSIHGQAFSMRFLFSLMFLFWLLARIYIYRIVQMWIHLLAWDVCCLRLHIFSFDHSFWFSSVKRVDLFEWCLGGKKDREKSTHTQHQRPINTKAASKWVAGDSASTKTRKWTTSNGK